LTYKHTGPTPFGDWTLFTEQKGSQSKGKDLSTRKMNLIVIADE